MSYFIHLCSVFFFGFQDIRNMCSLILWLEQWLKHTRHWRQKKKRNPLMHRSLLRRENNWSDRCHTQIWNQQRFVVCDLPFIRSFTDRWELAPFTGKQKPPLSLLSSKCVTFHTVWLFTVFSSSNPTIFFGADQWFSIIFRQAPPWATEMFSCPSSPPDPVWFAAT